MTTGEGGIFNSSRGVLGGMGGRSICTLYLLEGGRGGGGGGVRAGDCIYINTPLKQLRPQSKQQRLAGHILMAPPR